MRINYKILFLLGYVPEVWSHEEERGEAYAAISQESLGLRMWEIDMTILSLRISQNHQDLLVKIWPSFLLSLFFFYLYIYTHVHLVFLFISFVYERIMAQMTIYCTAIQSHIIKFETLNEIYSAWGWWGGKRQREGGRGNIRFLGNPLLLPPSPSSLCSYVRFSISLSSSSGAMRNVLGCSTRNAACI